jgi:hypothetical protein
LPATGPPSAAFRAAWQDAKLLVLKHRAAERGRAGAP